MVFPCYTGSLILVKQPTELGYKTERVIGNDNWRDKKMCAKNFEFSQGRIWGERGGG